MWRVSLDFKFAANVLLAAALLFFLVPATHAETRVAVAADVGTLGLGAVAVFQIKPWLNSRISPNWFSYATNLNVGGLDYDSRFKLLNFGSYVDIYPFDSKAHLSLGVLYNGNRVDLHKFCIETCTVAGISVAGPNAELSGQLRFNALAPYAGVGWGNAMSDTPFFMLFDAGVMFQGAPKVSLAATGTATISTGGYSRAGVNLQSDPATQSTLDYEREQITNDVKDYRYYPVVAFSMGWRFGH